MKVAIIGAGAAGYFAAIWVKENFPISEVLILEKTSKVLSKVRISGGGRCNVSNAEPSLVNFSKAYPRGQKLLKKAFSEFNNRDFINWLEQQGVETKTEARGHVFPKSNSSETIIDCLIDKSFRLGVKLKLNCPIREINPGSSGIILKSVKESLTFDKVIVTTGGSPKTEGFKWLQDLGHKIVPPAPSLFTFNMPGDSIRTLQGVATRNTKVHIQSTKLMYTGELLITHWGMSGPVILKLSAFGARYLFEQNYNFKIQIHWDASISFDETTKLLHDSSEKSKLKSIGNYNPLEIPNRLWNHLIQKAGIATQKPWGEIGKKGINRLTNILCNDVYEVSGKTTFKEEFVTAGGVSLESINQKTMESLVLPGLYFAGEVLDIDGITGGYNFQAAWTTAFIAARIQ